MITCNPKTGPIFENNDTKMYVSTELTSSGGTRQSSALIAASWSFILALTTFFLVGIAYSAEPEKMTTPKQGELSKTNQKEQDPDGWIQCGNFQSKQAYHDVTFNNCNGSSDLKITRSDYKCMYGPGNSSLTVPAGKAYQINLSDKNAWPDCYQAEKYVTWTTQAGGTSNQVKWRHSYVAVGNSSTWNTEIDSPATNGAGLPYSATCDGNECLNQWASADEGRPQVIIYFN